MFINKPFDWFCLGLHKCQIFMFGINTAFWYSSNPITSWCPKNISRGLVAWVLLSQMYCGLNCSCLYKAMLKDVSNLFWCFFAFLGLIDYAWVCYSWEFYEAKKCWKHPKRKTWRHYETWGFAVVLYDLIWAWGTPYVTCLRICHTPFGCPLLQGKVTLWDHTPPPHDRSRIPWNLSFRYILFHVWTNFLILAGSAFYQIWLESIHIKDESKRGFAFAFIFGVNWPVQWVQSVTCPIIFGKMRFLLISEN